MILAPLRWLANNLSTLLLALILAIVVWVTAVVTADPNVENTLQGIPLTIIGQDPNLLIIEEIPETVQLTIKSPQSVWDQLNNDPDLARAWIDLAGLPAGEHLVPVKSQVSLTPTRVVNTTPAEIRVLMEPLLSQDFPVDLLVRGEPPLGYQKETAEVSPQEISITGPESAVNKVAQVRAIVDISGATQTVISTVPIQALDSNGAVVSDVNLTPKSVTVTQPISLLGGFRNVAVKVITTNQVANGYRLTNITVTPPNVTVFSNNPDLVNQLPGYVETFAVDLTGLTDDIEINVGLNIPSGISLVREPSVLVQVGVAAIEGSLTISTPVEILGLSPGLAAVISPPLVDLIVSGPLPILDTLTPASFRVVINLTDLEEGSYQIAPIVDLVPDQISVDTILPETVEVTIGLAPTATPTYSGFSLPTPSNRRTPTPQVTATP